MEKEKCSYPCGGKGPRIARRIARGIVIGLAFALVFGLLVQLLWNWLMPGVFGLREIHYAQAIGLGRPGAYSLRTARDAPWPARARRPLGVGRPVFP